MQHVGHVGVQKIKCRPIRTPEKGGIRLQEELYVTIAAIRWWLKRAFQRKFHKMPPNNSCIQRNVKNFQLLGTVLNRNKEFLEKK